MRFITYKFALSKKAEVCDNYVMGGSIGMSLGLWEDITVTGNTVWAARTLAEISSAPSGSALGKQGITPDLRGYHIDKNTYIENGNAKPFLYGAAEGTGADDRSLAFTEWQRLSLDANSNLVVGENRKPTGTKVFVFPNREEAGRAQIAVFNWDGLDEVDVPLRGILQKGQTYVVYNCLDVAQTFSRASPAVTAVFDGEKIRVPMKKASMSPDFDAFLVLPALP